MNKRELQRKAPRGEKLAYINDLEAGMLKAMGGSGAKVKDTGIRSYDIDDDEEGELAGGEAAGGYGYGNGGNNEPRGGAGDGGDSMGTGGTINIGGNTIGGGPEQRAGESDADFKNRENPMFSNAELASMREGGNNPPPITPEQGGDNPPPPPPPPTYEDSQGGIHTTQEAADAADEQFQALTDAEGTATGTLTDYGADYGDDYFSGLESDYAGSYTGERELAYNAALEGIYDDFKLKGIWDQEAYDEQLALVDAGVLADTGMLDDFTGTYSQGAEDDYNTWYANQTEGIQSLYGAGDIEGLTNFELGELDMTGYDPTSDDFKFEDFNFLKEFKKIYPDGSTEYTDPSTIADDEGGEVEVEGGTTGSAAPGSMLKKKARSKVPTYTSSPLASGGSSSTH